MLEGLDWRGGFVHRAPVLDDRSVRVVFAPEALDRVVEESRALGSRVLLVAGPHEDQAAARVGSQLAEEPGAVLAGRLREVTQHVPVELARAATDRARELEADVLVAVGGGSATGLAKAVARETGLPILAVPTTYAGSEMTPVWGLTDEGGKRTGRDPRVLPVTVVYDPSLTVSLPVDLTAASGMNALAHAVEALYAPDAAGLTEGVADEALRALARALPEAVARPGDLTARSEALYGAWLAGWCLGSTTMGLHHKLAHVLGGRYRLPHAGLHSVLLPQVAAFNAPAAGGAFSRAARAVGVDGPDEVGGFLFELAVALGAPTSLRDLGLPDAAIEEVAAVAARTEVANPRSFDEADLLRLLRDAQEGRHPGGRPTEEDHP